MAANLFQEFFKSHFSLCNKNDVSDNWLVSNKVNIPHVPQSEVRQHPAYIQFFGQLPPVSLLQSFWLHLNNQNIHLQS